MSKTIGKNVLVTGASRGVGAAIAKKLAGNHCSVALNYKTNKAAAESVLSTLPHHNGSKHFLAPADLSSPQSIEQLVDLVVDRFKGRIDILVNNAGIVGDHSIVACNFSEWVSSWQSIISTNLLGPAFLSFHIAQCMIRNSTRGRIINVSSRGAFRGEPEKPAYGASKAGLNSLTQSLAIALAPHNISVMAVAPGFIETDLAREKLEGPSGDSLRAQSPFNRVLKPEEVANAVALLAADGLEMSSGAILDMNCASYMRS